MSSPAAGGLHLALVKPDFGVVGGFELLVGGLARRLRQRGHAVEIVSIDATRRPGSVFGYPIAPVFREWHDEYFRYLELAEATQQLWLDRFDVVCATQPPTYLVEHDHLMALVFHQYRVFYDLADEFVAAGFVDAETHRVATEAVRAIDGEAVPRVGRFLAGSDTVAGRLRRFWQVGSSPYRHPPVTEMPAAAERDRIGSDVLCVSRQEWPKRTELFVAAMQLTAAHRGGRRPHGHLVGAGSRRQFVESLDAELASEPGRMELLCSPEAAGRLWRNQGIFTAGWQPNDKPASGRVTFHGRLDDKNRNELYRQAAVIVAPALDEDYGLTVLEAWQQRRPVIVCSDGGGLTELVQHGCNGLVVEPTPFAIAQAIDRLCNDPSLADQLVAAGSDALAEITWESALDSFEAVASEAST